MAKLVNALDLGPSDFCFESSSLSTRTLNNSELVFILVNLEIKNLLFFKLLQLSNIKKR